jgi:hypothetical protein
MPVVRHQGGAMTDNPTGGGYIDGHRSVPLDDVGGGNLLAATLIGADYTCLAIVDTDHMGDGVPMIDPHCRAVVHEQTGALPAEYVRRLTS